MRTKAERRERIERLTEEWLTKTLEAIRDGKASGSELQVQFFFFAREHGIDAPQDKSLRNLIVVSAARRLKAYSELIKEARKKAREVGNGSDEV